MILSFLSFLLQDILCKIKKVLVDEKRHLRFAEWNGNDVSTRCSVARLGATILLRRSVGKQSLVALKGRCHCHGSFFSNFESLVFLGVVVDD